MDYFPGFESVSIRHAAWDKVHHARMALRVGYRYVFVLDADTIVVDLSADPREALRPGSQLGMVFVSGIPYLDKSQGHWQSGALYIHTGAEVREFLAQVWKRSEGRPDVDCWHEQATINELLLGRDYPWVERLPDRWNSTWCMNPCDNAIVLGFHGTHANKADLLSSAIAAAGGY